MRGTLVPGAALAAVSASAVNLTFDDAEALLSDNSNAATASVLDARYPGVSLSYYRFIDSDDPTNSDPYVPVTAVGYADYPNLAPVSGRNAVDGFLGSIIVGFSPASPLSTSFGINVVGNGGFGNPNATVRFFDSLGTQIDAVGLDLSRPSRFTYSARPFASVQLPSGAYFDDLTVTPVPEPASLAALATGAIVLLRRRRRP